MADVTIRPLSPTAIPHLIASHIVKTAKKTAPAKVDLAAAVIDVEHRTQIAGAGMVSVTLMDPDWVILESPFIEVNDDGLLDEIEINFPEGSDSWWRLAMVEASTDLTQPNVTLTFEDRIAAYLRDKWGPKKVAPGTTTRAQFVKQLVDEVGRHDGHQRIRFVCPELNVVQPVAVASVAAGASTGAASLPSSIDPVTGKPVGGPAAPASSVTTGSGADASKGRGIGAGAAVTAKGQPLDAGQIREANTLLGQANALKAGPIATEAIICAGIGESWLGREPGSFAPNSAGYWGVLQGGSGQKGSAANFPDPHDTAGQASSFLLGGKGFQGGGAIALARGGISDPGQIAALVEGSGAGADFYGRYRDEAKKIIAAGGGITAGAQGSTGAGGASDVGQLQRGTTDNPDENSWDCIQQLAGDVGWYAFSNADTLYYMDGPDLVGQKPALYLDRVKNVDQIQSFNATWDNSAFLYQSTKKVKGKVQRRTRIAKPQTPAEVRLNLVCQPFAYRAGDCFVLKRFGPANGRWIVADATRRCLSDTFTQFTLIPPREAYPEPLATADTATTASPTGIDGYVNPLAQIQGLTAGRVDMGVDYSGSGPLLALGDATIFTTSGQGWPGGGFVGYTLSSGPYKGKHVFVAENITATVVVGQKVKAGDQIATLHAGYPNLETGWASGSGDGTLAASLGQQAVGDPGGWTSAAGASFNTLLTQLGAPSGIGQGTPHGTMPAGFPSPSTVKAGAQQIARSGDLAPGGKLGGGTFSPSGH